MKVEKLELDNVPDTFGSVEDAIKALKLDRRRKWEEFMGSLCHPVSVSLSCTGCDGGGCHECGYRGKRKQYFPVYATHPKTGEFIKIKKIDSGLAIPITN